jgi:hypothetical protein
MSATSRRPEADPLYGRPLPERPVYATGMLLDAADFSAEQTYHRGRLARALGLATGGGTLAGLRVGHQVRPDGRSEVQVAPGVAIDRLGRLIEVARPSCLGLDAWWQATPASALRQAVVLATPAAADHAALGKLVSPRTAAAATLPAQAVVADVFLRFVACPQGYTPAFASGPYDALDAVATARLRDAYELLLVARDGLDVDRDGLPDRGPDLAAVSDPDQRSHDAAEAVLAGWPVTGDGGALAPGPEHPLDLDASAQFIARLLIPVTDAVDEADDDRPLRDGAAVIVDNWPRRFAPSIQLLQRWLGLNP